MKCCLVCGLWVMWGTPELTCRLPSGFSLLQRYLSLSECRHRVMNTRLMLPGKVCVVLRGITYQRGLNAVIFLLLSPCELTGKRWLLLMGRKCGSSWLWLNCSFLLNIGFQPKFYDLPCSIVSGQQKIGSYFVYK